MGQYTFFAGILSRADHLTGPAVGARVLLQSLHTFHLHLYYSFLSLRPGTVASLNAAYSQALAIPM